MAVNLTGSSSESIVDVGRWLDDRASIIPPAFAPFMGWLLRPAVPPRIGLPTGWHGPFDPMRFYTHKLLSGHCAVCVVLCCDLGAGWLPVGRGAHEQAIVLVLG
jgi:hypothetical protein